MGRINTFLPLPSPSLPFLSLPLFTLHNPSSNQTLNHFLSSLSFLPPLNPSSLIYPPLLLLWRFHLLPSLCSSTSSSISLLTNGSRLSREHLYTGDDSPNVTVRASVIRGDSDRVLNGEDGSNGGGAVIGGGTSVSGRPQWRVDGEQQIYGGRRLDSRFGTPVGSGTSSAAAAASASATNSAAGSGTSYATNNAKELKRKARAERCFVGSSLNYPESHTPSTLNPSSN